MVPGGNRVKIKTSRVYVRLSPSSLSTGGDSAILVVHVGYRVWFTARSGAPRSVLVNVKGGGHVHVVQGGGPVLVIQGGGLVHVQYGGLIYVQGGILVHVRDGDLAPI